LLQGLALAHDSVRASAEEQSMLSVRSWFCLLLLGVVAGCGGSGAKAPKLELQKFGIAYHEFAADKGRGPAKLDDLQAKQSGFPTVYKLIQDGEVVVVWNGKLFGDSDENDKHVLGYEKAVPEKGGVVLLGGGTVRDLSAEEFKKTPKLPTQ
jgi:hypothetical protein